MAFLLRLRITVGALFLANLLWSQPDTILFQQFTTAEGLPHNLGYEVQRDRRGFLWIATAGGVSRFDGYQFKNYLDKAEDAQDWGPWGFNTITMDRLGRIWTASARKLFWFDEPYDRFREYPLPPALQAGLHVLDNPNDTCIWLYQWGTIWKINAETFHLDSVTTAKFPPYHFEQLDPEQQRIWFGGHHNADTIQIYNIRNNSSEYLSFHGETKEKSTFNYFQDSQGRIWVGSEKLACYDPRTGKWKRWTFKNEYGQDISNVFLLPKLSTDTVLWLKNEKYLRCFDTRTGKLTRQYFGSSFIGNTVAESSGGIWLFTEEGLFGYTPRNPLFRFDYLFRETIPAGLPNDCWMDQPLQHRKNSDWVWLTPFGYGLALYDWREHHLVRHYLNPVAGRPSVWSNAYAIYYLSHDRLWVFGGSGILALDEKTGNYQVIIDDPHFNWVWNHAVDQEGNLWFEHYGKFYVSDSVENRFHLVSLPFAGDLTSGISGIRFDLFGNLWVVTDKEFVRFQPANGKFQRVPIDWSGVPESGKHMVTTFEIDSSGHPWISTLSGLLHYDLDYNTFKLYDHRHGFASGYGEDLTIDSDQNIWMSSRNGLFRFDPQLERFAKIYLPGVSTENTQRIGTIGNLVWLATYGGAQFLVFDPKHFAPVPAPKPLITAFRVRGETYPFDPDSIARFPLRLKYRENVLTFEFTAVVFEQPEQLQFEHRLDPFDEEWIASDKNRTATYTNLGGGDYTFRVRSLNTWGLRSEKEAAFRIHVIPPFYRTAWFAGLCVLFLAGIFYTVFRYRELQRLDKERIRLHIARDLHDEVGSILSSISILSEAPLHSVEQDLGKSRLTNIGEKARKALDSISDIVWTVNPLNDSMEKVIERMTRFAVEMLEPAGITVDISIEEKVNTLSLSMEMRKEVYLIYKEAVNNCAKYSRAERAWVSLSMIDRHLVMEVVDNGIGFDVNSPRIGNGLKNMEARAKAISAEFQIQSKLTEGTNYRLKLPLVP